MWVWRGWFRWDVHHAVSRDFWQWQQLRHSLPRQTYPARLLRFPSPLDRWRGVVSSATISTPLTHLEWAVCIIFILSSIFTRGSKVLPLFFLCKVGMKRLCGKGAFLLSQKFSRKRCSFLCTFSKPVKGENFLRYPLSSKPNDFMPLIARKNQGSTPMPLLK